jgi:hypothetical protein
VILNFDFCSVQRTWALKDGNYDFKASHKVDGCGEGPVPAEELAIMAIEYAKELEMIV